MLHVSSNLICMYPSIDEITLIECYIFSSIVMPHLNKLKTVYVNYGSRYIDKREIKAQTLWEFILFSSSSKALKLDLCTWSKLQVLKIDSKYISLEFPQDISLAFPFLTSLFLYLSKNLQKFRLLSSE